MVSFLVFVYCISGMVHCIIAPREQSPWAAFIWPYFFIRWLIAGR
jgi:hypothetical protein